MNLIIELLSFLKLRVKNVIFPFMVFFLSSMTMAQVPRVEGNFPIPEIPFSPKHYVCYRVAGPIDIDGNLDEASWKKAAWTDYFVDIQGNSRPIPRYRTRVKMLWDDKYLYVGAELQEPNLWATLRLRDTVVFYDNDFEVFIDPNGSTQPYYETEINALGTVWDLLLRTPYRDGNKAAVNAWDIKGLKVGIGLHGTLNNPADVDTGWTVEIAFPWSVLGECALNGAPPTDGAQWRINFSRVEWHLGVKNGKYFKEVNPATGQILPEDNWVWSPQGLINMHYPEMWGFVQFSDRVVGEGETKFIWNPVEDAKWDLRLVYYAERQYYNDHGEFTPDPSKLELKECAAPGYLLPAKIYVTPDLFEATLQSADGRTTVHIRQDGLTWITYR